RSHLFPVQPFVWNVPYRRNPFFTGRDDIIVQLHNRLSAVKNLPLVQPQAITGLGGIGKTQTVLEYAYRFRNNYRYVLWTRAATLDVLNADFVALARLLQLREKDERDQQLVVEAMKRWLSNSNDWLLIFDNADDLQLIYDFLPLGSRGHVLLTTRTLAVGTLATTIELEKMNQEEGVLLLLRRARIIAPEASLDQVAEADRSSAEAIATALDGLPLALDQVGAYIEETGCSLSEYLTLYQTRRKDLLKRQSGLPTDYLETVATTWSISFQKIKQANSTAAALLQLCAFLAPDAIPLNILTEGLVGLGKTLSPVATASLKLNEAMEGVRKYSLIRRNTETKMLSMHRLVQTALRDDMNHKMQRLWAERAVRAVNRVFPDVEVTNWSRCQQYLPHARECALHIEQWGLSFPEAARLLHQAGYFLYELGRYPEAEPLLRRAVNISEQIMGQDHLITATRLNSLAVLYQAQGSFEKAEQLYLQTLAIREKAPETGDTNVNIARTLCHLAELYRGKVQPKMAEPLLIRALAIQQKEFGPEHPDTAKTLDNLARVYYSQAQYDLAEDLYRRTLEIRERVLGEHPDTADSFSDLAVLYHAKAQYEKAEPLYQRALAIQEKILGSEHPDTANTLDCLARLYQAQRKYALVETLYRRALAIREQTLGPEHPHTAISLHGLAWLYHDRGQYQEAERLYQQVLSIQEKVLGPQHSDISVSLDGLGDLYRAQGKYAQALLFLLRALEIREKALGVEHPKTALSLRRLALCYTDLEQFDKAELLYQRALMIQEKAFGSDHLSVAVLLEDYANLLEKMGKEGAASLKSRAQIIRDHQKS
ncbi:MAG: tetratricopeptide repeat protein, partial [Ktedonobacteraceae bacterium]